MILQARADFDNVIFRGIIITGFWVIWMTRNGVIFDNGQIDINLWKRQFKEELGLMCIPVHIILLFNGKEKIKVGDSPADSVRKN
jgi:hypothetical protein